MADCYIGEIRLVAFTKIPTDWLLCDGSPQPISSYQALYALIGTTYGGDGVSTFNLPDLRGQAMVGQGNGAGLTPRTLGKKGGEQQVALSAAAQAPVHSHALNVSNTAGTTPTLTNGGNTTLAAPPTATDTLYATFGTGAPAPVALNAAAISPAPAGAPHDNMMPTLTLSYIIATNGVYPTPS